MVEDTTVRPVLTEWLSVVAPHLDLDSCILSGVATLHASRLALDTLLPTVLYVALVSGVSLQPEKYRSYLYTLFYSVCLKTGWCQPTRWWSWACP